jgi:hypothetical protein
MPGNHFGRCPENYFLPIADCRSEAELKHCLSRTQQSTGKPLNAFHNSAVCVVAGRLNIPATFIEHATAWLGQPLDSEGRGCRQIANIMTAAGKLRMRKDPSGLLARLAGGLLVDFVGQLVDALVFGLYVSQHLAQRPCYAGRCGQGLLQGLRQAAVATRAQLLV